MSSFLSASLQCEQHVSLIEMSSQDDAEHTKQPDRKAQPAADLQEVTPSSFEEPSKGLQPVPTQFYIPLNVALSLLFISHAISALYAPILDCDETYNYFEPLHYLLHPSSSSFQTWEYSPTYALRSWAYILIHGPLNGVRFLPVTKRTYFHIIRLSFAFGATASETRLYSTISKSLNPRIGAFYLLIVLTSPGIFHASTAFLPSSFAMYTSSLAMSFYLSIPSKTILTMTFFGFGALLGWPFAAALMIPFAVSDLLAAATSSSLGPTVKDYANGVGVWVVILAIQDPIDSLFYRRLVMVPLDLVFYNIFSGPDRGPDIFGIEPWHFYIRNLLLNFNLFFVLAAISLPVLGLQALFGRRSLSKQGLLRTFVILTPFYLWLTIFTLQPHKEERFMYPAYPFLALSAAITLHFILAFIGNSNPKTLIGKIPPQLKLAVILPVIFSSILLSTLRIAGTVTGYNATLKIYSHLPQQIHLQKAHPSALAEHDPNINIPFMSVPQTVCLGKDWYRFPTHFLLPEGYQARFIRSEFDGLLPGLFTNNRSGIWSATYQIPEGMNDVNAFESNKVISVEECDWLVDSYFSDTKGSKLEPLYIEQPEWERVHCEPLLDAAATHVVGRTIWLPHSVLVPEKYRRQWGMHCLLKRKVS